MCLLFLQDGEVYVYLFNVFVSEYCDLVTFDVKDLIDRVNLVFDYVERMGCKRYLDSRDIVEGLLNLNFVFIV